MPASTRLAIGLLIALAVWGVAYWLTPAPSAGPGGVVSPGGEIGSRQPRVTFDTGEPGGLDEAVGEAGGSVGDVGPAADPAVGRSDGGEGAGGAGGGVRVIPPEFDSYVVREGDTPNRISRRLYGTDRYWSAILRANPLRDLHRGLRVGMTIRVPRDPENVQGVVVDSAGERVEGQGDSGGAGEAGGPAFVEYTVRRGDTLTEIAARVYGSASRWTLIRDANRDKTGPDGTRIRPGMVLRLPPKPAE